MLRAQGGHISCVLFEFCLGLKVLPSERCCDQVVCSWHLINKERYKLLGTGIAHRYYVRSNLQYYIVREFNRNAMLQLDLESLMEYRLRKWTFKVSQKKMFP